MLNSAPKSCSKSRELVFRALREFLCNRQFHSSHYVPVGTLDASWMNFLHLLRLIVTRWADENDRKLFSQRSRGRKPSPSVFRAGSFQSSEGVCSTPVPAPGIACGPPAPRLGDASLQPVPIVTPPPPLCATRCPFSSYPGSCLEKKKVPLTASVNLILRKQI